MHDIFMSGVPADHVLKRLALAGGNEVDSGKLGSADSSAALAINAFGWFIDKPHLLPPLPGLENLGPPEMVDVEFCARFPWSRGRHPWLGAVVQTASTLVGIESKRFEPFRDAKRVTFADAYNKPVWGDNFRAFERLRDDLNSRSEVFVHLDAAQLVKHAFGLVTEGRRRELKPILFYIYAEPTTIKGKQVPDEAIARHRDEVARFAARVAGDEVDFRSGSYRDWLSTWTAADVAKHAAALIERYNP